MILPQRKLHSQPRIHQVRAADTSAIKHGVHRNLPEAGKLRSALARVFNLEAVVGQTVIQSIGPICIGVGVSHGYRCRGTGVICEARIRKVLKGIDRVIEEWRTEPFDRGQRDPGKSVQSDQISINFIVRRTSDVGHPR